MTVKELIARLEMYRPGATVVSLCEHSSDIGHNIGYVRTGAGLVVLGVNSTEWESVRDDEEDWDE